MMSESSEITYSRSFPVRVAKFVLYFVYATMPKSVYDKVYGSGRCVLWKTQQLIYKIRLMYLCMCDRGESLTKARIVGKLLPYTMGGHRALEVAYDVMTMAEKSGVNGAIVECGVAKGGCAAAMALASINCSGKRKLWLFDSYEGLPDPTDEDFNDGKAGNMIGPLSKGMLVGTIEEVKRLMFDECMLPTEDVKIVKGWFQDTLPISKYDIGSIAVLRLDGDWYESTWCGLENLYDQVSPNGFIIIDDYATCYGAKRAVNEFLDGRGKKVNFVPDGRGGVWFQKLK